MTVPNDLIQIARIARKEMEQYAWDCECDLNDYRVFGDPQTLASYCAISSWFFMLLAKKMGYTVHVAQGNAFDNAFDNITNGEILNPYLINHSWNVYKHHIIDITATQFKVYHKVFVTPTTNENYIEINRDNKIKTKQFNDWVEEQKPLFHENNLKKYHLKRALKKCKKVLTT